MQTCANPGSDRRRLAHGLLLVGLGVLFLAVELGEVAWRDLKPYWPALVSLVGLTQLFAARHAEEASQGLFGIFLGAWLYASGQGLWGLSYRNSWPVLLLALGLVKIATYLATRLTHKE